MTTEKPSGSAGPLLGCFFVTSALIIVIALLRVWGDASGTTPAPDTHREGEMMTFRGVVGSRGNTAFSGRPYFEVEAPGGRSVTCQYTTGGPPPQGTWVTIAGKAVVWVSGSGTFRPCVIVGR